jgi:hypothetical protein
MAYAGFSKIISSSLHRERPFNAEAASDVRSSRRNRAGIPIGRSLSMKLRGNSQPAARLNLVFEAALLEARSLVIQDGRWSECDVHLWSRFLATAELHRLN